MSDTHTDAAESAEATPKGKAYVIVGFRRDGRLKPSVGVLIVPKALETEMPKAPDRRMLDKMGFEKIESVEAVELVGILGPTDIVLLRTHAAAQAFFHGACP